jgi:hypothetical protein
MSEPCADARRTLSRVGDRESRKHRMRIPFVTSSGQFR